MAPLGEEARAARIEAELEALKTAENVERIALPWRDERGRVFPVIHLPLNCVALNPESHRIKEQLESSPSRQLVAQDPFGEKAQAVLEELLEETEGFEDLKANLAEVGQAEAGAITRKGVLVNANTRAVALRRLDPHGFIRVAVLPPNADQKDIARLELALQMKRDFKQEYTFANQLLFVEDLKRVFGYTDGDVAKAMNLAASSDEKELKRGTKEAAQLTRFLAMIRELQNRSSNKIPLSFFNDKKQALIDLDQAYEDVKVKDPDGAERLKESRFLAVLLGSYYREIRTINPESAADYLLPALKENPEIGEQIAAVLNTVREDGDPPGLEAIADDRDEQVGDDLSALVNLVASSFGSDTVVLPATDGDNSKVIDRDELVRNLTESVGDAIDQVRRVTSTARTLDNPIKLIDEAHLALDKALDAYRKVATNSDFRVGKLEPRVRRLQHSLDALRAEIDKQRK